MQSSVWVEASDSPGFPKQTCSAVQAHRRSGPAEFQSRHIELFKPGEDRGDREDSNIT